MLGSIGESSNVEEWSIRLNKQDVHELYGGIDHLSEESPNQHDKTVDSSAGSYETCIDNLSTERLYSKGVAEGDLLAPVSR